MTERAAVVHIGLHKCGSTTLQRTLTENRWRLLEQDYFYSVDHLPSKTQHSHLALSLRGGNIEHYTNALSAIRTDFERSECNTILFSGEEFSTLNPDLVEQFCRSVRESGFAQQIRVILYVRNFYDFMLSLIAQYSKGADAIIYPQTALSRMRCFNPSAVIRRWENAAGQASVHVECLDLLPRGTDIVDSFAKFISAEIPKVESDLRENQSVDAIASSILSHLAYEFGLPDTLFYRSYFSELRERFTLPRTETHLCGLIGEWVAGIDLSHAKLHDYQSVLRTTPMQKTVQAADTGSDTELEQYLLFMASVMQNTSARLKDRRLRLPESSNFNS